MKNVLLLMIAVLVLQGCEKSVVDGFDDEGDQVVMNGPTKKFKFTIKGDFGAAQFKAPMQRAYMSADGSDMTDLWLFDYVDGKCIQTVHQTKDDADWGTPQMSLAYGEHHVYFVASRGDSPIIDADGHTITWDIPRDAFWKDYEVNVVSTSNGNRAVTLDRVATKLRVIIDDVVPNNLSKVVVTPDRWYYGIDYTTGEAVSAQKKDRSVSVPANMIGTTGELSVSIFGISGADEWTTNITVSAYDGNGTIIGNAKIAGAPFKRNRATEYSGSLFGSTGGYDVSLDGVWENPKTGNW